VGGGVQQDMLLVHLRHQLLAQGVQGVNQPLHLRCLLLQPLDVEVLLVQLCPLLLDHRLLVVQCSAQLSILLFLIQGIGAQALDPVHKLWH
jgi:hypothetical protein